MREDESARILFSSGAVKGRRGHWCWCCGRVRPNERFSGRSHARHLCRDCATLGTEELRFRQAARDLARCFTWEGYLRRRERKSFEAFLHHPDSRVREHAAALLASSERLKKEDREAALEEAPFLDAQAALLDEHPGAEPAIEDDIPF